MLFRIRRINGDKTIRVIYEVSIGRQSYNSVSNNEKYVGFVYDGLTSSTIKTYLDEWYASLISTNPDIINVLTKSYYCNNTSVKSVDGSNIDYDTPSMTKKPSFKCPETLKNYGGKLNLNIGIPSVDEKLFAGSMFLGDENLDVYNYTNYTDDDSHNWTMTPHSYYNNRAYVTSGAADLYGHGADAKVMSVNPVLNRKLDTRIDGGNGSKNKHSVASYA